MKKSTHKNCVKHYFWEEKLHEIRQYWSKSLTKGKGKNAKQITQHQLVLEKEKKAKKAIKVNQKYLSES